MQFALTTFLRTVPSAQVPDLEMRVALVLCCLLRKLNNVNDELIELEHKAHA